jgi:phosphoribosylformylglycinamidine cyclo-ligase
VPPIFPLIQEQGNIREGEMHRVFNMGIGMVLVCSPSDVEELTEAIADSRLIGEVVEKKWEERVAIV